MKSLSQIFTGYTLHHVTIHIFVYYYNYYYSYYDSYCYFPSLGSLFPQECIEPTDHITQQGHVLSALVLALVTMEMRRKKKVRKRSIACVFMVFYGGKYVYV